MTEPRITYSDHAMALSGVTDAVRWADEFCRQFMIWADGGVLTTDDAHGLMVTWFANAIETGRDAGRAVS